MVEATVKRIIGWESRTKEFAHNVFLSNRPERLNAFNMAMWRRLAEVMAEVNADDGLRCVVLRGAGGKAFGAGADIAEFPEVRASAEGAAAYAHVLDEAMESEKAQEASG